MPTESLDCTYIWRVCFQHANPIREIPIFGFAEFFAAIALLVLAYTLSDEIYKFRIRTARFSVSKIFPLFIIGVSLFIILFDLYFINRLPIPYFLNHMYYFEIFSSLLTIIFISYWIFVAFAAPPTYSKENCVRFGQLTFMLVSGGTEAQLNAAAFEIGRSSSALVTLAHKRVKEWDFNNGGIKLSIPVEAAIALDLFLLIGDRRFCRVVARQLPWVAAEIFHELSRQGLHGIRIFQFARNVSYQLIKNEDSAIHSEDEGYLSGLLGEMKPVTNEIFGNYRLVEDISNSGFSQLDVFGGDDWVAESWNAYFRVLSLYFNSYVREEAYRGRSQSLMSVGHTLCRACDGAFKLDDADDSYFKSVEMQKITGVIEFVTSSVTTLNRSEIVKMNFGFKRERHSPDVYDTLSHIAFSAIEAVSLMKTSDFRGWMVQHNSVWGPIFNQIEDGKAADLFYARLRRLIFNEVMNLKTAPNFQSANVLGLCLNVMGLDQARETTLDRHIQPLRKTLIPWVQKNFLTLHARLPEIAEACLCGTITYDETNKQLVKTYRGTMGQTPSKEYLSLDAAQPMAV
jgi:hypothetical protein